MRSFLSLRRFFAVNASSVVAAALAGGVALAATPVRDASLVGKKIDGFTLRDYRGKTHSLSEIRSKAVVVIFLGTDCPLVQLYARRLQELAKEFEPKGATFLAINANAQDPITKIGQFALRYSVEFPILKDPDGTVTERFGATRTPEAFILDQDRIVRYHGRVDDQYGVNYRRGEPRSNDLVAATNELLSGKPIARPETPVDGCLIGLPAKSTPRGDVTYSNQVSRIFAKRCLECHRSGQIGPFPLDNYREAAGWASMIREVIDQNRMPPWFADPQHGRFSNDTRLSPDERATLLTWIDNGAPEGNPSDSPPPTSFAEGWRIKTPDMVIPMSKEAFKVPATGFIDYKTFTYDPGFKEDVWIQAAEARAGNRAVVHHLLAYFLPPKGNRQLSQMMHQIAGYAPGTPPFRYPPGTALRIPAGSKILFQLHYTPIGVEQEDISTLGMVLAKPEEVKHEVRNKIALNFRIKIPPGEANYHSRSEYYFDREQTLINLAPHMHLRGKAFRFELTKPDGTREVLLDVPRYDFNWQLRYDLFEPLKVAAGSRLVCSGVFDNSADNLANPDPSITVTFGEQTTEEMMVGVFQTIEATKPKLSKAP